MYPEICKYIKIREEGYSLNSWGYLLLGKKIGGRKTGIEKENKVHVL